MKSIHVRFAMLVGPVLLLEPVFAREVAIPWQTAQVLSAELNGHGPSPLANSKSSRRRDIWWTYCVSTGAETYTAVLRESPAKSGMRLDSTIRMSVQKDRMRVLDRQGKHHFLRVIRQSKGTYCR